MIVSNLEFKGKRNEDVITLNYSSINENVLSGRSSTANSCLLRLFFKK
jgi:hypothetical protein